MIRKSTLLICLFITGIGALLAATLPTSAPVHRGLSHGELLGYIADRTQMMQTGSGVATLPVSGPAHAGMSQGELLAYIADYTQDLANRGPVFHVSYYGAFPNDGADDTAAIQAALNAAKAAGGGWVQMSAGIYNLITINSPASGNKAAGAFAIEPGSYTTLAGVGPSTMLSVANGGEFGVGVAISPDGMRTATTNFGAASYVTLQDFTIQASVQHESAGNLINLVHASSWTIRNVHLGSCYYHPLEIDQSKQIVVQNCRFFGANTGISGSRIQLDYGAAGPTNRPAGITTRTVEDLTVENCVFEERTAGESGSARDIELTHNGTELTLNRVTFRGCHFTGRNEQSVSIVDIGGANSGGAVKELLFERCTFVTLHPKSYAFYMAQSSGMTFRGIRFRQCEFTGPSAIFLVAGGSVTSTYSATHSLRHEGEITGCRFILDKTQMPVSTDLNLIIAVAWSSFRFDNNYIECNGDFPVSVGLNYSRLGLFTNSLWTEVTNNRIVWNGNATFGVNRLALLLDVATPDNAGTTQGVIFEGNRFFSAAGTGWSYVFFVQRGTTYAATSAARIAACWANGANSAQNNMVVTGGNAAGQTNGGALALNVRTVTGATTITPQDGVIIADTTSASITVTAAAVILRPTTIILKPNAANTLTFGGVTVSAAGSGILVVCDGTTTTAKAF
jgi:polygalacturonase